MLENRIFYPFDKESRDCIQKLTEIFLYSHTFNLITILLVKRLLSFLLLFQFVGLSYSQSSEMKTWYVKLQTQPENRYEIAEKLRNIYMMESVDSLFSLGNLTLQSGIDRDNYGLMMLGKLILSNYYVRAGKSQMSHDLLNQCISYYERKSDFEYLSDAQNIKGMAYLNASNHAKAIEYFVKSIENSNKLPDDNESYQAQINLAEVYYRDGLYDLAEAEAMTFLEKAKKRKFNIAAKRSYDMLGKVYIAKGDTELAFSYFHKALHLALKEKSMVSKAHSYNNVAIAYFENGDLELAKENFKKALNMRLSENAPIGISESYYNLGDWHYFQNQFKEAIPYYVRSKEIADSNNLMKESADALFKIGLTYDNMKDYKSASRFYREYIDALIAISKVKHSKQLDMQRIAYEMQREEDRLIQSKREHILRESNQEQRSRAKMVVIVFSVLTSASLLLYLFTILKRNINRNNEEKIALEPVISELETKLVSKWEALEAFIDLEKQNLKKERSYLNGKVKLTSNVQAHPLSEERLLFWESNSSKLESYVFNEYMYSKVNEITDLDSFTAVIKAQDVINPENITYGLVCDQENQVLVCGNNGLLIQNENKMAFMTENSLDVKEYAVFVSENLKNYLIENKKWEAFLKQIDMTSKMSAEMALTTIDHAWADTFNSNQLGVLLIQP